MSAIQHFFYTRVQSFRHALRGWSYALRTQPNAWIHATFTLAVIILGAWLRLSPRDWAIIIFTITLVWSAEFLNTAIEVVIDLVSPNNHPLAKVGKDAAAGSVLVTAIGAILIGLLILGPPLWQKLQSLLH